MGFQQGLGGNGAGGTDDARPLRITMIFNEKFVNRQGGVRLDAALFAIYPSSSRAFIRDAIGRGDVLVNEKSAAKGLKLCGGETVEIRELLEACDNLVTPAGVCPHPIFEDDALLAFDKPCGMPVQPLSCRETGTLMNAVAASYPECRPLGDVPLLAGALHRIDADTSGLVMVARSAESFAALRSQFTSQTVKKTYLAMVEGSVAVGGTLDNELVHDPTLPFCKMIDYASCRYRGSGYKLRPMHAVTQFKPIGHTTVECEERTLLEVTIHTGVTHQIRAQLAIAGMHIVNDRLYGAFAVENQSGHCLHALAAAFSHPKSGVPMEIRTPLPVWARI